MYANEIEDKMSEFPDFLGVYARDDLPSHVQVPMGLIVNTDARIEEGTHWVAIFIDDNSFGQYFDSFGLPPFREEFKRFLDTNSEEHVFNNLMLQCSDCITCGHYCCAFLAARFNGFSYADFISHFSKNKYLNDEIIKYFFNEID